MRNSELGSASTGNPLRDLVVVSQAGRGEALLRRAGTGAREALLAQETPQAGRGAPQVEQGLGG